jgi:ABC-type dipeptide/oligopeptide/nickel transport system permease component
MERYIFVRLMQNIIALIILSIIIFFLVRLSGDPALLMLPEGASKEDYEEMKVLMGLNKPIYLQYGIFLLNAIQGDFGRSIRTKRPVIDSIKEALPNSIKLVLVSLVMAILISIPLGVKAATKKGTPIDIFARIIAGLGQSIPSFWLGLMIMQLFVVHLKILPSSGIGTWRHYLMPGFCLAIYLVAGVVRLLRSSMLEALDSEYIKMARIKGLPEKVVVYKHALRNSILPVLSFGGMYVAIMITGAILIETVFAWPGIGRLAYRAIITQDFPLIQGVVICSALVVMISNLITDILYTFFDPRIRH